MVPSNPSSGPPKPHRARVTPLTPMRVQAAKSMSRLADHLQKDNPDLPAHQHLRDAARTLRAGNEEAAQRHLRAAMFSLTPGSLMRNGQHTDDLHITARQGMHGLHRHLLLVKDIADVAARNQAAITRDSYGGDPPSPSQPPADPNAGYGPGALAQKPTARQPPGNQALNAPARSSSGGSDPAVADPGGPQPKGSKQFTYTWDDLARVVELAGRPKVTDLTGDGHGHHIPGTSDVYRHGFIPVDGTVLHSDGIRRPAGAQGPGAVKSASPKAKAPKAAGKGILTGPHPADKMTVATDKSAAARSLSDDGLRSADQELSRRAAALGKPGQVSKSQKAVRDELAARGKASSPPGNTAGSLKPGDKIMGAFQPGTGPSAHTVVSAKTDGKTVHLTVKDSAGNTYKSDVGAGDEIVRAKAAAPAPPKPAKLDGAVKPDYVFGLIPKAGTQVSHPDHGTGTVISTSGTAVKDGSALVKFKDGTSETFGVDFNRGIEPGEPADGLARAVPDVPVTGAKTMYDLPDAQSSAVNKYIGGETERAINDGLRGIGGPPDTKTKRQIATMDKAVQATHLSAPTTLYRGIALRPPGFTFKAGDTFTDSGFTSVSTSPDMAKEFADLAATGKSKIMDAETMGDMTGHTGGTPAVMHLNLPAGQPMGPGDASVGEFILPRGTQYKVTSVNPDGSLEVGIA